MSMAHMVCLLTQQLCVQKLFFEVAAEWPSSSGV